MSKIKLTCDSTCDFSEELLARYNITVRPLFVTIDAESKKDGVEIKPDDIYNYYEETGKLPKTAAANMADYMDFFEENMEEDTDIIHFNLSSSMSVTGNNARMAAEEYDNVYVVDTANLSTGSALLVLKAADLIEQGLSAKEIVEEIEKIKPCVDASFIVDNLEYLHKGGRCSTVAALGANVLRLKPCIEVKGGAMGVGKKYRGRLDAVLKSYVADRLADAENIELDRVFVTHSGCRQEIIDQVVEQVKETLPFKEVFVTRAGCTISVHCGPNTLGVLFVKKTPIE